MNVSIVPHTHWDREWYLPFQRFRLTLVETIDSLLNLLESDPEYRCFLLDGQMAMIDDYLEIRPEREQRIKALATAGRLTVGPWYVLADEFLISGETLVRNLQMGIARASEFASPMQIGYLPDMFGHIAQMPQLLTLAGFRQAVVWRGVPSAIERTAFAWQSPDGSSVRAEYLIDGYSNGVTLPEDPQVLLGRIREIAARNLAFTDSSGRLLVMNGSDHQPPQPYLAQTLGKAREIVARPEEMSRWNEIGIDDVAFEITSLPSALDRDSTDGLPLWQGELRSGARSNLLMGVSSNRIDVKIAADRTYLEIEKRAEPYCALFLPPGKWPGKLLDTAWKFIVLNAAHDSICACSVDEVVDEVLGRFSQARQIAQGLATTAIESLAMSLADPGTVIVNPSPFSRSGVIELTMEAGGKSSSAVQVLAESNAGPGMLTFNSDAIKGFLPALNSPKIDDNSFVQDIAIETLDSSIEVRISLGPRENIGIQLDACKQELLATIEDSPQLPINVHLDRKPTRRILARIRDVPGYGWKPFGAYALDNPAFASESGTNADMESNEGIGASATPEANASLNNLASAPPVRLGNGLVDVIVDLTDGTFTLNGLAGMGQLVDDGDAGDSYNYSPPPVDTVVNYPHTVNVTVEESGPLRARVRISSTFIWPVSLDRNLSRRTGENQVTVNTQLEVRADEPYVRVSTAFINSSQDHRLRVRFPLPHPTDQSSAGCAFGTVRRGLEAEGRPEEIGLPTFPSRGFVSAGGLTIVHQGLCEYELTDSQDSPGGPRATSIALTLLRSTSMLSRLGMRYRPFPAGPLVEVEGLKLLGQYIVADYALMANCDDPYRFAEEVSLPLEVIYPQGGGWKENTGSAFEIDPGTAKVSALKRTDGCLDVRLFNPASQPTTIKIAGHTGDVIDFTGRVLASFDGALDLRPFGIVTIRLHDS
ncbi:MAG: glycoside hydrolase family 38 N-terminal domain-containing protein [Acidimicrobiales bacterium]